MAAVFSTKTPSASLPTENIQLTKVVHSPTYCEQHALLRGTYSEKAKRRDSFSTNLKSTSESLPSFFFPPPPNEFASGGEGGKGRLITTSAHKIKKQHFSNIHSKTFCNLLKRSLGRGYLCVLSKGFCAEKTGSFSSRSQRVSSWLCKSQHSLPEGAAQGCWSRGFEPNQSKQQANNKNKTPLCLAVWNSEVEPSSGIYY